MSDETVVRLGPHARMSPEEALAEASAQEWDDVIICGYYKGSNELAVVSSRTSREAALWIIEHTKLHVLDML